MGIAEVLLIAVGLALDAFAVSLGVGVARRATSPRPIFRLAFHFGMFQFLMPVLGWYAGTHVARYVEAWDHWIALPWKVIVARNRRTASTGLLSE